MRALVYRGGPSLVLEDRPRPQPGDGEALVRVEACSICGTDLRIAAGAHGAYVNGSGRVPGHEVAGTVVQTGRGCAAAVGQRVFVAPNYGCGRCRPCRRGWVNLCEERRAIGITEDGVFAEYLLLKEDIVAQGNLIPWGGMADAGAVVLAEPLACAATWLTCLPHQRRRRCRHLRRRAGRPPPLGIGETGRGVDGARPRPQPGPAWTRRRARRHFGSRQRGGRNARRRGMLVARLGRRCRDSGSAGGPAAQRQALELAAPGGHVNFFAGLARGSGVELDTNLIHYKELVVTGTTASTNAKSAPGRHRPDRRWPSGHGLPDRSVGAFELGR